MINQKGYALKMVLIIFALLIGIMMFPIKYPVPDPEEPESESEYYCRELVDDPDAPVIQAPSYDGNQVSSDDFRDYKLIKENVPLHRALYIDQEHEHFFNNYKQPYTDPKTNKRYIIRIPKGEQGQSYKLPSELGNENFLTFSEYGLIYLFHTSNGVEPDVERLSLGSEQEFDVIKADIYKAVDTPILPDWVLKCYDVGLSPAGGGGSGSSKVVFPKQEVSPDRDELQLEWFLFNKSKLQLQAWWTPHCKPAVYLYPRKKQLVNVRVFPKGELAFTDPPYDLDKGWTVNAFPNGQLLTINYERITNNYLYYESKIKDSEIKKPAEGWVVKFEELESLFNRVLPKLGLNPKEQKDFSDYWLKQLPNSPYYFVGLVNKEQRDYLEPLEVTPKPDTSIRFSFFFEPLNELMSVYQPEIITPARNGFTLVDWGGMIKLHKDTPFTCSQ